MVGSSYYEATSIWLEWNRKVIKEFTGIVDYLSVIAIEMMYLPKQNKPLATNYMAESTVF
ncbi:MAG: hypothetical protein GX963_01000 [Bacteroidales bacterium]|nr:hypothetical protein [Bacteroidales bacterium]